MAKRTNPDPDEEHYRDSSDTFLSHEPPEYSESIEESDDGSGPKTLLPSRPKPPTSPQEIEKAGAQMIVEEEQRKREEELLTLLLDTCADRMLSFKKSILIRSPRTLENLKSLNSQFNKVSNEVDQLITLAENIAKRLKP